MNSKKLGEICKLKQWKSLSASEFKDTGFPVYGANGIIGYYNEYNHEHPTIAISCRGTCGNVHITQAKSYITSNAMALDEIDEDACHLFYLAQYLRFRGLKDVTTGAAQPQITRTNLEKVKIPLPPLDDQIRIAHLLSKMEGLIAQRKKNLQQLDELLKSVFLEVFREVFAHEEHEPLGNHIDVLTDYHANGSYEVLREHVELLSVPNYALMVRTTDLEKSNFENGCNYITKEAYEFLTKSKVFGGEIIINKIGSAGKVYLMPNLNRPVSLGMNAFLIRLKSSLNNIYTYFFLTSDYGISLIQKRVKGAVTKTITKEAIRSIRLPIPGINQQNQFAAIVEKVESLKSRYQQSLTELEHLYGTLSQKAFMGELDLSRVPLPAGTTLTQLEETNLLELAGEQSLTFNADLSQIEQLDTPAMSTAQGRTKLLEHLFEKFVKEQHSGTPLSLDDFWQKVQLKTTDYMDDSEPIGLADYDQIKKNLFRLLESGELIQTFNEDKNRIELHIRG